MSVKRALKEAWDRIERWALNPGLYADPIETRKARLMLVCCLASGPVCMGVIIDGWLTSPGSRLATTVIATGHVLVCSSFLLLRWCSSMKIPAMAMSLLACGQILNSTWWTGGFESPVLFCFPVAMVFVGLIGGRWHSLMATLVLSIGGFVILTMDMHGYPMGSGHTAPEVIISTLVWAVLTGSGMSLYTQLQTDALLLKASEEVVQRRAAQEQAEKANEDKDMFIAYLSHEIRNPLAVIMGTVDLASTKSDLTRQKHHLEVLRVASHSLSTLLDDVLDYSSMRQGRLQIRQDSVNLVPMLEDIVRLYKPQAERSNLDLSFQYSGAETVLGDMSRLRQVMTNLVGNALKYTRNGSVRVFLNAEEDVIRVSVQDTGPGIPLEKRERIFQPYERGVTGDIPGTGLGLSVSRELLHRMNSELMVDHPESGGCLFHFALSKAPLSIIDPHNPTIQTVLVVDDNREAAELLGEMITKLGYSVQISFSGENALELISQSMPDVLLLDVNMPGLTGVEVSLEVRKRHGDRGPTIWFVTGNPMTKAHDGIAGILMKPVELIDLREALKAQRAKTA
jgi:signal transduction histidine kinase